MEPLPRDHIDWPAPLVLPDWARALRWGMAFREVQAAGAGHELRAMAPVQRWAFADTIALQRVDLSCVATCELDALVRIELSGPIDRLTVAPLGTVDELGYHRAALGEVLVEIDVLDGVIALEAREVL